MSSLPTSLQERHLEACQTKDYWASRWPTIESVISEHCSKGGSSVWHFDKTAALSKAYSLQLDAMPVQERLKMPLWGLSCGVKDLFSISQWPTTAGSAMLKSYVAGFSATLVQQLTDSGSLMSGKTSMDEFAMGSHTNTSYLGRTHMPSHPEYSCGGSSGGSAASLMAGLFDYTIGSDTGGSVRQPASICGLVGFKPSYGSISRHGMIAYASSLDQAGFFTKTVSDMKYLFSSISHTQDPKDSTHKGLAALQPLQGPVSSVSPKELKVGYFPSLLEREGLSEQVKAAYEKSLSQLRLRGAQLVPVDIPLLTHASAVYYTIACAEASSNLARYQGIYYGESLKSFSEAHSYKDYQSALPHYRSSLFGTEVQRRILLGSYVLSAQKFDAIYKKADQLRQQLRRELEDIWQLCDTLILPTTVQPQVKWDEIAHQSPASIYMEDFLTVGFSLCGSPVISVPCTKDFILGKTTGLQLVAPRFSDMRLLDIALALSPIIQH